MSTSPSSPPPGNRSSYSGASFSSPGTDLSDRLSNATLRTPVRVLHDPAAPSTIETVAKIAACLRQSSSSLLQYASPPTRRALSNNPDEALKKRGTEDSLVASAKETLKRKREESGDPVVFNDKLLRFADRSPRLTKREIESRIPFENAQFMSVLAVDAATGKSSFEAYNMDHIVDGEIRKNDPKGLHVFPTDPDIVIDKKVTSFEGVTAISWRHSVFSPVISKCSTLFKKTVVSPPPETFNEEKETKRRVIEVLTEAQAFGFRRPVDTGALKRYTNADPSSTMYIESLKEKPSSHLVNTAYPIFRLIGQETWEGVPPSTSVPITEDETITAGQVPNMIREAITNYGNSSFGKNPIRYRNDDKSTYLVEIASQVAKSIPKTNFVKEGIFVEASETTLRGVIPPGAGTPDSIFNTLGVRKSTRTKPSPFKTP